MPLYEYRCKQCGHQFEKIQSFSAPELKECPECNGEVERLISAPAVQFKGSGWYVTDYASKGGASKSGNSSASGESSANTAASSTSTEKSTAAPAPATPAASAPASSAAKSE